MYTDKVLDHFQNPRNVGKIDDADGIGEIGSPQCGDVMKIYIKVDENEIITDLKFQTYGCGAAVSSSSVASTLIIGKSVEQALKFKNKDALEVLGGLPTEKIHCSVLAEEAIKAAIWDYSQKTGKKFAGLEGYKPNAAD